MEDYLYEVLLLKDWSGSHYGDIVKVPYGIYRSMIDLKIAVPVQEDAEEEIDKIKKLTQTANFWHQKCLEYEKTYENDETTYICPELYNNLLEDHKDLADTYNSLLDEYKKLEKNHKNLKEINKKLRKELKEADKEQKIVYEDKNIKNVKNK